MPQEQEICDRCSKPLALGAGKLRSRGLIVFVAAVAVDLAADFAAEPSGAVNVYVSSPSTNRRDQFVKFTGANSLVIRKVGHVRRRDSAGYGCWRRGTGLSSRGTIAEVGAKEHADRTTHALLSKVDMSL